MLIKHKDKILILKEFDFKSIKLKQIRKNCRYSTLRSNFENYTNWAIKELSLISQNNKKLNACCIYMNTNNTMKLWSCLDAMTWLNISPTECNDLQDNQYAIDLSELYTDDAL